MLLAGLLGGAGLLSERLHSFDIWLCQHFTCYFSGFFWWFFVTPICCWLIYRFYMATHQVEEKERPRNVAREALLVRI